MRQPHLCSERPTIHNTQVSVAQSFPQLPATGDQQPTPAAKNTVDTSSSVQHRAGNTHRAVAEFLRRDASPWLRPPRLRVATRWQRERDCDCRLLQPTQQAGSRQWHVRGTNLDRIAPSNTELTQSLAVPFLRAWHGSQSATAPARLTIPTPTHQPTHPHTHTHTQYHAYTHHARHHLHALLLGITSLALLAAPPKHHDGRCSHTEQHQCHRWTPPRPTSDRVSPR